MRRAQTTIFVILGIALLIIVALFLLRTRVSTSEHSLDAARAAPVRALVTSCAEQSLENLLRRAGANGGYLDTSKLRHAYLATDSDIVSFPPQEVAYWSHLRPCQESELGCEASEQPPLCKSGVCPVNSFGANSLQQQLETALPAEVERCIENFRLVSDQFTVERKGPATASIQFTEGEVVASLTMPVLITEKDSGLSLLIEEFSAKNAVDLVSLYRLANALAQGERDTAYLERLTLHLISIYSGTDQPLPPMRDVTILGQKRYWSRTQVEQVLQDEVLPWTSFIQVPNALAGFAPIWPSANESQTMTQEEQEMYAGIFQDLYVKTGNETYPDFKARFFYPYSKPYLSINGGQELLKPRSADVGGFLQKIVGLFMNDYRFRYDLSYPVIVTLTDTAAFDGKGFDWAFALEANIRRNEPVNRSMTTSQFLLANERVDLTSPQQRVRNTVRISTFDKQTQEPLPYTRVSYRCGDEFFIGETDERGILLTRLPYCRFGGVLLYSRDGYLGSGLDYDNYEEDITKEFRLELWPLRNVTVTLKKRTPEDIAALMNDTLTYESVRENSHELNESDLAVFNLERIKETPYDDDIPLVGFTTFSAAAQNLTVALEERRSELESYVAQGLLSQAEMDDYLASYANQTPTAAPAQQRVTMLLAPGAYKVESFLIYRKQITIPEETREFCLIGGGPICLKKQHFTMNETNFTSWLSGGASLNEGAPYNLGANTLYRTTALPTASLAAASLSMTFYVLEQPRPATWKDLEEYQTPEEFLAGKELLQEPTTE
jgi:hypothetical protein